MLAAKSAGPKMIVSSRGDAAQISSTLISPRCRLDLRLDPDVPDRQARLLLHLGQQQVERHDLGGRLHLGQHDLVEALPGVAHDLDHVAVGPLGVPCVDVDAQHAVVPGQVLDGVDDLGPGALLLQRRDRVLEVEEASCRPGRLGPWPGTSRSIRGWKAGTAGQVTRACGHDPRVTNRLSGPFGSSGACLVVGDDGGSVDGYALRAAVADSVSVFSVVADTAVSPAERVQPRRVHARRARRRRRPRAAAPRAEPV